MSQSQRNTLRVLLVFGDPNVFPGGTGGARFGFSTSCGAVGAVSTDRGGGGGGGPWVLSVYRSLAGIALRFVFFSCSMINFSNDRHASSKRVAASCSYR